MGTTHTPPELGDCMAHARPRAQHALLHPFAGTFRATVRMWMGPGEPMVSTGTMVNTLDLNGLFLRQDYVGDPNDGPFPAFEGRGFWGYNSVDERWEGVWVDNAGSFMHVDTGRVDASGRVWTMSSTMTDPGSGRRTIKRSVITLHGPERHTMETYFTPHGGAESKLMEIDYRRA